MVKMALLDQLVIRIMIEIINNTALSGYPIIRFISLWGGIDEIVITRSMIEDR